MVGGNHADETIWPCLSAGRFLGMSMPGAVAGAGHEDHIQVVAFDEPVQVRPDKRQRRARAPVAEQPMLDVLDGERFAQQGIVAQVDRIPSEARSTSRNRSISERSSPPSSKQRKRVVSETSGPARLRQAVCSSLTTGHVTRALHLIGL